MNLGEKIKRLSTRAMHLGCNEDTKMLMEVIEEIYRRQKCLERQVREVIATGDTERIELDPGATLPPRKQRDGFNSPCLFNEDGKCRCGISDGKNYPACPIEGGLHRGNCPALEELSDEG